MKTLLLTICVLFNIGCMNEDSIHYSQSRYSDDIEEGYQILDIEGCEYIYFHNDGNYGEGVLTHKGNCNNPIHCYNEIR